MSTLKSFSKTDEARIIDYLRSKFNEQDGALVGASDVSAALNYSATRAREFMTQLALSNVLLPELVMVCVIDGTESYEDVSDEPLEMSCHTCGETTQHTPSILFKRGPKFSDYKGKLDRPKKQGRLSQLRFLRPLRHQRSVNLHVRPIV